MLIGKQEKNLKWNIEIGCCKILKWNVNWQQEKNFGIENKKLMLFEMEIERKLDLRKKRFWNGKQKLDVLEVENGWKIERKTKFVEWKML